MCRNGTHRSDLRGGVATVANHSAPLVLCSLAIKSIPVRVLRNTPAALGRGVPAESPLYAAVSQKSSISTIPLLRSLLNRSSFLPRTADADYRCGLNLGLSPRASLYHALSPALLRCQMEYTAPCDGAWC